MFDENNTEQTLCQGEDDKKSLWFERVMSDDQWELAEWDTIIENYKHQQINHSTHNSKVTWSYIRPNICI